MLRILIGLVIIAVIAGALGFSGVAGAASGIAQIGFYIFIALLVIGLLKNVLSKA